MNKKDKLLKFDKILIFPEGGSKVTIYDLYLDINEFKWKKWKDYLESIEKPIPKE